MNLHKEIANVAYELYEKRGRINGLDLENWLEAERIVLERSKGKQTSDRITTEKDSIKKEVIKTETIKAETKKTAKSTAKKKLKEM